MKNSTKKKEVKGTGHDFEYRHGKSLITGKSGNSKIVRLAERDQRYRFILRCGWLVVGVLAIIFNVYPEYVPLAALIAYVKSIIFKV